VQGLLSALGTRAAQLHRESVPCAGGSILTIAAISQPTTTGNLDDRLAARLPDGAQPCSPTANLVAFRDGRASLSSAPPTTRQLSPSARPLVADPRS
jgi:hypothetical protein